MPRWSALPQPPDPMLTLDKPRRRVAQPPPGAASIGESSLPLVGRRCRQIRNVGPGQPRYFRDLGSIEIGDGDDDHPFCACGHFEEYLECNPLRGGRIDAKLIRSVAKAICLKMIEVHVGPSDVVRSIPAQVSA